MEVKVTSAKSCLPWRPQAQPLTLSLQRRFENRSKPQVSTGQVSTSNTTQKREVRWKAPSIISTGAVKPLEVTAADYTLYLSMHLPSKKQLVLHISLNKYPNLAHHILLHSLVCKWQFCYLKTLKLPFLCREYATVICSVQTSCLVTWKLQARTLSYTLPPLSHSLTTAEHRMHTWIYSLFTHFNSFGKNQTSGQMKVMLNTGGNLLQFNGLQKTGGQATQSLQSDTVNWDH